jgi:hypothetical protein
LQFSKPYCIIQKHSSSIIFCHTIRLSTTTQQIYITKMWSVFCLLVCKLPKNIWYPCKEDGSILLTTETRHIFKSEKLYYRNMKYIMLIALHSYPFLSIQPLRSRLFFSLKTFKTSLVLFGIVFYGC